MFLLILLNGAANVVRGAAHDSNAGARLGLGEGVCVSSQTLVPEEEKRRGHGTTAGMGLASKGGDRAAVWARWRMVMVGAWCECLRGVSGRRHCLLATRVGLERGDDDPAFFFLLSPTPAPG